MYIYKTNVFRFELSNFCGQNRLFSQCNTFEQINAITIIYYFKVIRIIFADRIENNRILIWYKRIKRNSGIVEKKNNRMDRKIDAGKMRGKFVGSQMNEKAFDFVCDPRIGRKRKSKAWWTLWEVGALIRLDQREKIERQLPSDLRAHLARRQGFDIARRVSVFFLPSPIPLRINVQSMRNTRFIQRLTNFEIYQKIYERFEL